MSSMPRNPRRTTLGAVNTNLAGTPSGKSNNKPKARKSRQSMLPRVPKSSSFAPPSPSQSANSSGPVKRRTSLSGRVGGRQSLSVVKQDPRPLNDRAFQQSSCKLLLKFLHESHYEKPISLKTLQRPSSKDFYNIVTHLLRQVDPTFPSSGSKLEEEVALQFKALGYPYSLSKTALVAAGSPHTWPALLGATSWLAQHLMLLNTSTQKQQEEKKFENLAELEHQTDKAFFSYLHSAYQTFLAGESSDDALEALVEKLEGDNDTMEQEMERVTELNLEMVEKLNSVSSLAEDLPALEQKRLDYATDLEQFADLVQQMDLHKANMAANVEERTAELVKAQEQQLELQSKIESLKNRIANQDVSMEQWHKMQAEQALHKEALEKATIYRKSLEEEVNKAEQQLHSLSEELQQVIRDYTHESNEWNVGHGTALPKISVHDVDKTVVGCQEALAQLEDLQQSQAQHLAQLFANHQEALDKTESASQVLRERQDELTIAKTRLDQCTDFITTEQEQADAALQVRLDAVQALRKGGGGSHDAAALEQTFVELAAQQVALEQELTKNATEMQQVQQQVRREIQAALKAVQSHRAHVLEQCNELERYKKSQHCRTLKVPAGIVLE